MGSNLQEGPLMLKLTLMHLLAAISLSGCAYSYCYPSAFHGCGGPVDPVYAPFAPMPQADHVR
jgi:hypothetical protein